MVSDEVYDALINRLNNRFREGIYPDMFGVRAGKRGVTVVIETAYGDVTAKVEVCGDNLLVSTLRKEIAFPIQGLLGRPN
jgi:hypothetical protein